MAPPLPVCLQLSLYLSLAPEAKLTYPLAGPAGQAAFNAGVQGFEAQSFRGLGVFTSTPVSHLQEHSHTLHVTHGAQRSHGAGPLFLFAVRGFGWCALSQPKYDFQSAMMTSFNTHNNVHHTTL